MKITGLYPRVRVDTSATAAVGQAGGVLLIRTVAVTGLDRALSAALAGWRKPLAVHDPGKIITDLALSLALGGDCLADLAVLRAEPGVYGRVASDPTVSRAIAALAADAPAALKAIDSARAAAREQAWRLAGEQAPDHGFWITSDLDEKRNGFLRLGREAASELTVNPEFYQGYEITDIEVAADRSTKSSIRFAKDRGPQTLHGRLTPDEPGDSVPVSILQAHSTRWTETNQTFRPIWSIVGGHIEPRHPFPRDPTSHPQVSTLPSRPCTPLTAARSERQCRCLRP